MRISAQEKAFNKALGSRMRQRRQELGLSQTDVAAALNIAQQTYAHYEVGRYRMPVFSLTGLAHILKTDMDSLLGIESAPSRRSRASRSRTKRRKSSACRMRGSALRRG
jgi:transcriptional regulator with XRE-family HTH domain